jgi:hypothetical protein
MNEIPVRFPPPLSRSTVNRQGIREPVMENPVIECGMEARLGGQLVVCIRRAGHPVRINYGHSNGYTEWAFDA